jgi:OOP family OmpA-OmpF porin
MSQSTPPSHATRACLVVLGLAAVAVSFATGVQAAPGDPTAATVAQGTAQPPDSLKTRTTSLPAKGLFVGDQLSPLARERLTEFIVDVAGLRVEVVLVVPTGPWQLDGSGRDERDLTPARLQSVKRFLAGRGVQPNRIFVESRIDSTIKEPRLDVQTITRGAVD